MTDFMRDELGAPKIVGRSIFQAELDALRVREKAHTREGDAIAAAQPTAPHGRDGWRHAAHWRTWRGDTIGRVRGTPDAHRLLLHVAHRPPCARAVRGLHLGYNAVFYLHSRDVTFAVFAQGPYEESSRYRDFMGWDVPWYSAVGSLEKLLVGRRVGRMHIVCYLRQGDQVFETYWNTARGVEAMDNSYRLLDLTVYGRQEKWEDSPPGWPQQCSITRTSDGSPNWAPVPEWPAGRPIAQWPRLKAGRSDDLGSPR